MINEQAGFVSSHFFFRLRQVKQPVLLRPFGALEEADGGVFGCFLGLPRGRRMTVPFGVCVVSTSPSSLFLWSSGGLSILVSMADSSSSSSILGMTSLSRGETELSCMYETLKVKVVPVFGESPDEAVELGDVLTLSVPE